MGKTFDPLKLQKAIDSGNITSVRDIIDKNGSKILLEYAEWDEPRRESPIHRAINQNQIDVSIEMLQHKKCARLLGHKDFRGETPLHRCGWCGRTQIAEKLIKMGAKVNVTNSLGLTPLHLAAERGKLEIVNLLIQNRADVNSKSNQGNTPLHRATTSGHNDLIVALLKANASPGITNNKGTRAGGRYSTAELLKRAEINTKKVGNKEVPAAAQAESNNPEQKFDVAAAGLPAVDRKYYDIEPEKVVYGKKLGEGGFGTVYEGTVAGQPAALKQLSSPHSRIHENFRKELEVMCRLRHPNIVLLMGAVIQPDQLCLVMEVCRGGTLTTLLKYRPLKIHEVVTVCRDIALAMNWLHSRNPPILHLDLKPANILLADLNSLQVKVSDFGLARPSDSDSRAIVGTRRFMAPEMMRKLPVNEAADVYSFGILLWQIYTRRKPFSSYKTLKTPQEKADFAEAVWNGYRPSISLNMPPLLAYLMTSCWNLDPNKRPTFKQVILWLNQIKLHGSFMDSTAQVFWDHAVADVPNTDEIRESRFEELIDECLIQENQNPEDFSLEEYKLLLRSDKSPSGVVHISSFSEVANLFGPFSPVNEFLYRLNELVNAEWLTYDAEDTCPIYFPKIDKSSSIALLYGRPPGTFLIRNSTVKDIHYPFVLSYVNAEKRILHHRIFYDRNQQIYLVGEMSSTPGASLPEVIFDDFTMSSFNLKYATHSVDD